MVARINRILHGRDQFMQRNRNHAQGHLDLELIKPFHVMHREWTILKLWRLFILPHSVSRPRKNSKCCPSANRRMILLNSHANDPDSKSMIGCRPFLGGVSRSLFVHELDSQPSILVLLDQDVQLGDTLDGNMVGKVTQIHSVKRQGLYAPATDNGTSVGDLLRKILDGGVIHDPNLCLACCPQPTPSSLCVWFRYLREGKSRRRRWFFTRIAYRGWFHSDCDCRSGVVG